MSRRKQGKNKGDGTEFCAQRRPIVSATETPGGLSPDTDDTQLYARCQLTKVATAGLRLISGLTTS